MCFAPDGRSLYAARDGLWRYDIATGQTERVHCPAEVGVCKRAAFLPDGRMLLIGNQELTSSVPILAVWEVGAARANCHAPEGGGWVQALSNNGEVVAVLRNPSGLVELGLFSTRDGDLIRAFECDSVRSVCLCADGLAPRGGRSQPPAERL